MHRIGHTFFCFCILPFLFEKPLPAQIRDTLSNDAVLAKLYMGSKEYGKIVSMFEKRFGRQQCTAEEYKVFAAALLCEYSGLVVTRKFMDRLFGNRLRHSDLALQRVLADRPDDIEAMFFRGILEKYRNHDAEAQKWFAKVVAIDPSFRTYAFSDIISEMSAVLRNQGKAQSLEEFLESQMAGHPDPWAFMELSFAYMEHGHAAKGSEKYYEGLSILNDSEKVARLYLDAEPIASQEEQQKWNALTSVIDRKRFLRTFWKSRDPNPTDEINERLAEHYRRLKRARELYSGNTRLGCDDRGLIYVRMGDPSRAYYGDHLVTWIYEQFSPSGHYDFVDRGSGRYELGALSALDGPDLAGGPAEKWNTLKHLISQLSDYDPYYQTWAARMQRMDDARVYRSDEQVYQNYSADVNQVMQDLTIEYAQNAPNEKRQYFDFDTGVPQLAMSANFASFRDRNTSRLDFYYILPYRELSFAPGDSEKQSLLAVKTKVFDFRFEEIGGSENHHVISAKNEEIPVHALVGEIRHLVPPGRYMLAVDIRNNENQKMGIYKYDVSVRDYSSPALTVSDIQTASSIDAVGREDKFVKPNSGLRVIPNPSGSTSKRFPLNIYYEIYNLTLNLQGKTSYEVSYSIKIRNARKNIFSAIRNIFSGKRRSAIASVTAEQGSSATEYKYIGWDISTLPRGPATLDVKVRDLNSQKEASSTIDLVLVDE
jgi:GWxTD domain-containing protein